MRALLLLGVFRWSVDPRRCIFTASLSEIMFSNFGESSVELDIFSEVQLCEEK